MFMVDSCCRTAENEHSIVKTIIPQLKKNNTQKTHNQEHSFPDHKIIYLIDLRKFNAAFIMLCFLHFVHVLFYPESLLLFPIFNLLVFL